MTPYEAMAVFSAFERADDNESLLWRVDMQHELRDVKLHALCNDLFYWATADAEEIAKDDVPLLERTLADLQKTGEPYLLAELFAARKRKMRPQKPCYKNFNEATSALFDACCTEEKRAEADKKDAAWWVAFAHSQKGK